MKSNSPKRQPTSPQLILADRSVLVENEGGVIAWERLGSRCLQMGVGRYFRKRHASCNTTASIQKTPTYRKNSSRIISLILSLPSPFLVSLWPDPDFFSLFFF